MPEGEIDTTATRRASLIRGSIPSPRGLARQRHGIHFPQLKTQESTEGFGSLQIQSLEFLCPIFRFQAFQHERGQLNVSITGTSNFSASFHGP